MKQIYWLLLGLTFFLVQEIKAQPFVTKWDLSMPGSSPTQLSFGVGTTGLVNYTWETIPAGMNGSGTFTGSTATITGLPAGAMIRLLIDTANFNQININNGNDKNRLLDVEQWGGVHWISMENAFSGCLNLNISSSDLPDMSSVTSLDSMFLNCTTLNGPINIQFWDVSNITSVNSMFENAVSFNQPLWSWNTSSFQFMKSLFQNCQQFNQPIGSWNTSQVIDMSFLLRNANNFNQDLSFWNLNNVNNLISMLDSCGIDCVNYSETLNGWSGNSNTPNNLTLGAIGMEYGLNAQSSWSNLSLQKSWSIIGDNLIGQSCPSKYFITKWNMALPGNLPSVIKFGLGYCGPVYYHWETVPSGQSGSGIIMDTLASISGIPVGSTIRLFIDTINFRHIYFQGNFNLFYYERIIEVENWGFANWNSMVQAFYYCENLNVTASDIPNLSNVASMTSMFNNCPSLTGPPNIGDWDVSNVQAFNYMFSGASLFNQYIGNWNTVNAVTMEQMFSSAINFNQNISNWDISNLINLRAMFHTATSFNQDLSNWDVSSAIILNGMFYKASSFNQNLGNWSFNPNVQLHGIVDSSGLDCINYSSTLIGWSLNPSTPWNKFLYSRGMFYGSNAQIAHNYLVQTKGWFINYDSMLNYSCCLSETNSLIYTACNSYYFNNQNLMNSGVYYDTLLNASGCDSIIVLNLTINQANASITQAGANLSATTSGATYQWLSCNPYQIISGAINQNYTATANGDYAVIVTENGCTDTSACVTVMGIGLDNNEIDEGISIYPNPTKDKLFINIGRVNVEPQTYIEIYNTLGRLLLTKDINPHTQTELDISHLAKGMYYLRVGHVVAKVIVE